MRRFTVNRASVAGFEIDGHAMRPLRKIARSHQDMGQDGAMTCDLKPSWVAGRLDADMDVLLCVLCICEYGRRRMDS